jgi:hypothetical protein
MPRATKSESTKASKPATTSGTDETHGTTRQPRRAAAKTVFSQDAVARRAYELFIQSGWQHGRDVEHWLMAERELLSESSPRETKH